MTRTRVLAALLAGLTVAGLGTAATALGSDDPAATAAPVTVVAQTRTTTPTTTRTPTPTPEASAATGLTAEEAVSVAVGHLGGGTATKVEWETEHGRAVWEVDVRRDSRVTEVHVDTATGSVTRVEDDGRDDRGRGRGGDDRGRHGGDHGSGHN